MKAKNNKAVTRFAPSPTGFLHIGGLRTALYAFLWARRTQGKFRLRIEDTDRERYVDTAEESLKNMLKSLGLLWDGKVIKQSHRLKFYKKYASELVRKNKAYFCFCSVGRLQELRAGQAAQKLPTGYDGLCRSIPEGEAETRAQKESHVVRIKMPKSGTCEFYDLVRGNLEFSYAREEDAIILKSDGFPTYHLAHVIDDHDMKVTHVIRGEEWLSSIPKHIMLWEALNWKKPEYAHLSLIINPDRTKLSKRKGDMSVESFLEKGYLKEALLNFVLLLGWNPGSDKEIFSLKEMIQEFTLEKINKSPAICNIEKLDWLNGCYIRKISPKELLKLCIPYLQNSGLIGKEYDTRYVESIVALENKRLKKLSDLPLLTDYFFRDVPYTAEMLLWKGEGPKDARKNLEGVYSIFESVEAENFMKEQLEKETFMFIKEHQLHNGDVLWPLRVALSGKQKSPGPFEIAHIMGKEMTLKRIREAIEKFS